MREEGLGWDCSAFWRMCESVLRRETSGVMALSKTVKVVGDGGKAMVENLKSTQVERESETVIW